MLPLVVDGAHLLALLEDGRGAEEDRPPGAEGRGRPGHELGPQGATESGACTGGAQVGGAQGGPLQAAQLEAPGGGPGIEGGVFHLEAQAVAGLEGTGQAEGVIWVSRKSRAVGRSARYEVSIRNSPSSSRPGHLQQLQPAHGLQLLVPPGLPQQVLRRLGVEVEGAGSGAVAGVPAFSGVSGVPGVPGAACRRRCVAVAWKVRQRSASWGEGGGAQAWPGRLRRLPAARAPRGGRRMGARWRA